MEKGNHKPKRLGEWNFEEDLMSVEYHGYHLLMKRHPVMKILLGYVGVTKEHLLYGQNDDHELVRGLQCHWGITFAGSGENIPEMKPDYWYFGFDCAHCDDFIPNPTFREGFPQNDPMFDKINEMMKKVSEKFPNFMKDMHNPDNYKNAEFVINEIHHLYQQLHLPKFYLLENEKKSKEAGEKIIELEKRSVNRLKSLDAQ